MATFKINRSSLWHDDEPPCEGARRLTVNQWDVRTFPSPAEFDERFASREGPWTSKGDRHGTWADARGSGIKRRLGTCEVWVIDVDDVAAFARRVGHDVIVKAADVSVDPSWLDELEIYDDYRE